MSSLDCCCLLVVDDDLDTRMLFKAALEAEGAEVVTASSAYEAIDTLTRIKPTLLLCDIAMPGIDGYSFLRHIRDSQVSEWSQVPAIAVTAVEGEHIEQRSLIAGFQRHVKKPVDLDELVLAIADLTHAVC